MIAECQGCKNDFKVSKEEFSNDGSHPLHYVTCPHCKLEGCGVIKEHNTENGIDCWCEPKVIEEGESRIFVHNE